MGQSPGATSAVHPEGVPAARGLAELLPCLGFMFGMAASVRTTLCPLPREAVCHRRGVLCSPHIFASFLSACLSLPF